MGDLAKSAMDSALPMFMQDAIFKETAKAPYSYMSIPESAPKHLAYIDKAFQTHDPKIQPKASSLDDHIYVLMAWDKLGLFRYGLFEDLRSTYDKDLEKSYGVHLVRTGAKDADYHSDWSLLPSPKPYFLFPGQGVYSEQVQYQKVHGLVEQALACGMIKIREDVPYTEATVNILYTGNAVVASPTLLAKAAEIQKAVNPATGDAYSAGEITEKLRSLLAGGRIITLKETEVKPANIASVLGLEHQPVDPFDENTQANIDQLKIARENHRKLCIAMTEVLIYTRPDLVRALEIQLPAYQEIYRQIHAGDKSKKIWENRNAYAETAANLFLFLNDAIFQGGREYKYKEKGNKFDIINPGILADDLTKVDSAMIKASCFLADAPEDNPAKADLARLLKAAMREYDDAVEDESITREDMEDLMTAADDTIAELTEDRTEIERALHNNPGRKDELEPQIAMTSEMIRVLEGWKRSFRKIMKRLD